MKKTYLIITAAIILTSVLHLVSCNDSDNYGPDDPSGTKQLPPTSLDVEVDSTTLNLSVLIGTIENAAYYELQMSEAMLTSNDDIPVGGTVYTFGNITPDQFVNGKITIERQNEQCEIRNNTTYYFRVRAIGNDGTVSDWYTKDMQYYGVDTPASLWVNGNDIDPDAITISWYKSGFYTVAKIRNETLGTEISAEGATKNTDYTNVEVWYYKWEGLDVNKPYTFSLLDNAGNVIATITQSTEYAPNMSLAHSILTWQKDDVTGARGESRTVHDPDNYFSIVFNEESAPNAGWTSSGKYYCQTPDKKVYTSPYRVQVRNTNTLEFQVPESGRMYLYANGSPTTYEVMRFTGKDENGIDLWEVIQKVTVKKDDKTIIKDEGGTDRNCYKYVKLKLSGAAPATDGSGKPISRYKLAPTASMNCYYYGFVFVPDDPNAGKE